MLVITSCGGGGDDPAGRSGSGTESASGGEAIEETVRNSFEAENEKDAEAFLALWTDKGLEAYDVGSREELESGEAEGFGREEITVVGFTDTQVQGDEGSTTVDLLSGESKVAAAVFRVKFAAIQEDGKYLLDGFEFVGSPPPAPGSTVVNVDATEYAFALDKQQTPGNVAFKFSNKGNEPHEIAFFRGPAGTDVAAAKTALENVNGNELDNVPAGYEVDHIGFGEPGSSADITFAEPLSPGEYFLVCYIPAGGFTEQGEPVNPQGDPHVKLGMINKLTVT